MTNKSEPCDLLIIDDDPEVLLAAELVLKKHFPSVTTTLVFTVLVPSTMVESAIRGSRISSEACMRGTLASRLRV